VKTFVHAFRVVVWNELVDAFRSRRAIALFVLYLLGSIASCAMFVRVLHEVEKELVAGLGLTPPATAGSVTETLWESDVFKHILTELVGDRSVAETLLSVPPLALFYAWLSFIFAPLLVMLLSSPRIAEEVGSGSVRFVLFRTSRSAWCLGKLGGQAVLLAAALLISAAGAWGVGMVRMAGFPPLGSIPYLLVFSARAWIFAWPFLGLALGVSQLTRSPVMATAAGFVVMGCMFIATGLSHYFTGDGWRQLLDVVYQLSPYGTRAALWHFDAAHMIPATVLLMALGLLYFLLGYAGYVRRDQ